MGNSSHKPSLFLDSPKFVEVALFALLAMILGITVVEHSSLEVWADANNGGAAYRSNTGTYGLDSPKYREWTGSSTSWSAEVQLPSVGHNVRSVMILFSPISAERVVISYDTNGDIDLFRCSGTCTTASNWQTIGTVATTQSYGTSNPYRPFCAAYEQQSGRLVISYDKGLTEAADFYFKTWQFGESVSAESSIDYIGSGSDSEEVRFCRMAAKVGSNELALVLIDATNTDSYAFIWNAMAAAFGNIGTITTITETTSISSEAIGVAYESSSGAGVAFSGDGRNSACWIRWTGSWGSANCNDPNSNPNNDVLFVSMKPDPVSTSNKIMICQGDDLQDLTCAQEDNNSLGSWSAASTLTASLGTTTARPFDFAWNPSGSTGAIFYETSNTADITVTRNTWSGSGWGMGQPLTVASATDRWFVATTNPTDSDSTINMMWLKLNSLFDVGAIRDDGTTFTLMGESTHTADTSVVTFADESALEWQKSTATPLATKTPIEGLGLSDANPKDPEKQLSENVGVSDTFGAFRQLLQQLNESLSLSDSRSVNATRRMNETAAISDATAFASLKSLPENVAASDAVVIGFVLSSSLTENLTASDNLSMASTKLLYENSGIADGTNTTTIFVRFLAENVATAENIAWTAGKSLSEGLTAADQTTNGFGKSLAENMGMNDMMGEFVDFVRHVTENVGLVDGKSMVIDFRSLLENLALDETLSASQGFIRILAENISLADAVSATTAFSNFLSENLAAADQVTNFAAKSLSENMSLSDGIVPVASFFRAFSENLVLGEVSVKEAGKALLENLGAADGAAFSTDFLRPLTENLAAADSIGNSVAKSVSESLGAAELIGTDVGKSLAESLAAGDQLIDNISKSLTEIVQIADVIDSSRGVFYTLIENLNVIDAASSATTFGQILSENIALGDSMASISAIILSIGENLSLGDALTSFFDVVLSLNEALATADGISDIAIDIQFSLMESLIMITSFFTPEVGYQSSLVSEDVSVADSLEIGTMYNVAINESISLNEDAVSQEHEVNENEDSTDDQGTGSSGHGRTHHAMLISETISVVPHLDLQNEFVSKQHTLAPTETLELADNQSAAVSAHNQLAFDTLETAVDTSTAFQLIPPAATSSIEFRIVNNGNTSEHVVLKYWCTDERGSKTCEGAQELEIQSNGSESRTVMIPFLQPGTYHVDARVGMHGQEVKATASLEINVPWTTVYLYPALLAMVAVIVPAAVLIWSELSKRAYRTGGGIL